MTSYPNMASFSVTPSGFINGATVNYKISAKATLPLLDSDKLIFTFPSEPTLPSSISCSTGTNIATVTCTKSGTTVTATFTFSGGTLAANTAFDFNVLNV